MRESEKLSPPWEIELIREDGRLVEITIRTVGDAELDYDAVREATNAALAKLRHSRRGRSLDVPRGILRDMYQEAKGRMTPEYLAMLAVTYEELASRGRAVMPTLAATIDRPAATVKGHVGKAREQGYLSEGTQGREGGVATDKARQVIADYFGVDRKGQPLTSNGA